MSLRRLLKPSGRLQLQDIKSAAPTIINGTRRWNVVKLASVLGVTPEEISLMKSGNEISLKARP